MGGVHVAEDVGFDQAVHGEAAEAADHLGVVGDFLGAEDDAAAEVFGMVIEMTGHGGAQGERGRGCEAQFAGHQQFEHAVLQDFGVGGEVLERAVAQAHQDRVGDIADAGLERQEVGGQAAFGDFVAQEVDEMAGDRTGGGVGRGEGVGVVRRIGFDDGDDLVGIAAEAGLADAVVRAEQRDRDAVGRQGGAVVDVVQALEGRVMPMVDLEDDAPGAVEPGRVVADGGGGDQAAVLADADDLDDGHVERAEEPLPGHGGDLAEMEVDIFHFAAVDLVAGDGVRIVGQAEGDAVGPGEGPIEFGAGGGAGPEADLEGVAGGVLAFHAGGEGRRDGFRVGAGEAAHAERAAGDDEAGGLFGTHDPGAQAGMGDPSAGHRTHSLNGMTDVSPTGSRRRSAGSPAPIAPASHAGRGGV